MNERKEDIDSLDEHSALGVSVAENMLKIRMNE